MNKAEWQLGGAEAMLDRSFHGRLPKPFRGHVEGRLLSGRIKLLAVLMAERGFSLAEGLAAEIEADRLFPSATIARSLMELVGLAVIVRNRMARLTSIDAAERDALHTDTGQYLLASRSLPAVQSVQSVKTLINAAKERYGEAFGEDYGFL